ncbi:Chromatin structure remodeling complex protein sfh1, partial [Ascosphaera acerosa]
GLSTAEDGYDDDFEESELSTVTTRRQSGYAGYGAYGAAAGGDAAARAGGAGGAPSSGPFGRGGPDRLGVELSEPVRLQPNFREWVVKKPLKPAKHIQKHTQAHLPLTLVPVRIDVEVPAHVPVEPFYLPRNYAEVGINPHHAAYRKQDPVLPQRIKDAFLWNLHEALVTPEEFAVTLIRDLDLPNVPSLASQVSSQIRSQLEEYAGVALHPLFQSAPAAATASRPGRQNHAASASSSARSRMMLDQTSGRVEPSSTTDDYDCVGEDGSPAYEDDGDELNVDDAYRCIIQLNINLQNKLYTDQFEWSLLHSQAAADSFARVTCADLGLPGEWVSALSHGICESVLRLKKEVCEVGGAGLGEQVLENQASASGARPRAGALAGWRYDPDGLGLDWEPKLEVLSPEEMEKREGDKERQIRRVRRETARFSSTSGLLDAQHHHHHHHHARQASGAFSIFDNPDPSEHLGRGERSKKKRRFRSLSPLAAAAKAGTPAPDAAGYGGGGGQLNDWWDRPSNSTMCSARLTRVTLDHRERQSWRCANCWVHGTAVWAVRDGPAGPRVRPDILLPWALTYTNPAICRHSATTVA